MEQIARAETMSDLAETADPAVGDLDAVVLGEHAFRLELLSHVARLDTEERWRIDGALSMAAWLATRYSLADSSAREWVKVARAITEQPSVRDAFAEGRLSWDQLRALIRLTNPDNEAEWAAKAPEMSVAEIRSANRTVKRDEVVDAHRDRSVRWWFDEDLPRFHMTVEMPDAEGAALATWLTRRASQYDPDPETGRFELFETRCADALHEFASQALADDGDHDRATIVIRTDLATLLGDGDGASFEIGSALSHDTLLRLTCDARIQFVLDGEKQEPIGVGRTTRTIPPWLARLVKARDKGCRFPGCGRTRWVQVHHIIHWSRGGRTDLDNLITLCGQHHRMLHEQGWTITGHPGSNITWLRPGGDPFTPKPPAYPLEEWRRFLAGAAPVYPPDRPPDRPAVAAPV